MDLPWREYLIFWAVVIAIIIGGMAAGYTKERPPLGMWMATVFLQSENGLMTNIHMRTPTADACNARIERLRAAAERERERQLKTNFPDPIRAVHVSCRFIILDRLSEESGA